MVVISKIEVNHRLEYIRLKLRSSAGKKTEKASTATREGIGNSHDMAPLRNVHLGDTNSFEFTLHTFRGSLFSGKGGDLYPHFDARRFQFLERKKS